MYTLVESHLKRAGGFFRLKIALSLPPLRLLTEKFCSLDVPCALNDGLLERLEMSVDVSMVFPPIIRWHVGLLPQGL